MKLVPLSSLRPSAYNPREADPARLDLVELSLRKLGWLLPVYADRSGEILSGHQRHHVARRMGQQRIPVELTRPMDLPDRKAVNIVFNRGTNDLQPYDTPANLTEALERSGIHDLAGQIPDKTPDDPDYFRCLHAESVPVERLLKVNSGRWVPYATNIARTLHGKGIVMPVVATADGKVVNGIGRLQLLAEKKRKTAPVVWISEAEARFADAMLNLLSMDFDLHRRYRDLLRYNSFRRARRVRSYLGRGFVFSLVGGKPAKAFDIHNAEHLRRWKREHGSVVLDFGAGHLTETEILRSKGIEVTPFEPYRLLGNEIDKPGSIALTREFLEAVAAGKRWDSIFLASVLNSVPFQEDRSHIATICAALCGPRTRLYAAASCHKHADIQNARGRSGANERQAGTIAFLLSYENGVKLGDFSDRPKIQKYHTPREFYALFHDCFEAVDVRLQTQNVEAICGRPRPVDPERLRRALEFEFNLPYPDGTRMGLVDEAKATFGRRLGVDL